MDPLLQVQEPWIRSGTTLGEGPLYVANSKICFIDIIKKTIHGVGTEQDPPISVVSQLGEAPRYI